MLTQTDRRLIEKELKFFHCTERETAIYLDLLLNGMATVQEAARRIGEHRVTVYSAIEQLLRKGLLYETRERRRRLIGAEGPDVLLRLIQQRENELQEQKAGFAYLADVLSKLSVHDRSVPTVKFYEGVDGFKKMLEETMSAKSEVLVFTYVDLFAELIGPDYLYDYYRRRAAKGISTRLIFPDAAFARKTQKTAKEFKMEIRVLPKVKWQAGIFSWNDCLALKSFTEGRITTSIIENRDIAQFYRKVIFELAWEQAKKVGTRR